MLVRTVLLQMAGSKRLEMFARHNRVAAKVASRFIAGERVEDVTVAVRALNDKGITVSLDLLGESVTSESEVAVVVDTYLRLFQHIEVEHLNANVSIKLTSLGMDISTDLAQRNFERLAQCAGTEQFIRIDMESSAYTQQTLDLFYRCWNSPVSLRNFGVVVQSYLRRSADDIEGLIRSGVRVRLCKGAYKEPASIAFQEKVEVETSFVRLMERLLSDGNYPGIATHDPGIIHATQDFARTNGIPASRFEFQMLYGVRRDLQETLKRQGYNVRVYTPFGERWYPYMMRRLAERPSNLWFGIKSIVQK